jgi:fructose-bisphosphate aldolase class II
MPIATPEQYAEMLDKAKTKGFAYPAVNVSSSSTINSVLQGFAEAESDGILQVTTGGADYFAGQSVKNRASGALAFAAFAHEVAKNYPVTVALHTDHCPKDALDGFVLPLIEASEAEVKAGRNPIFQSHMWDGSAVTLDENLRIAKELLPRMRNINSILEVEIGVVGGEEDGVSHDINEHLYTTLDDVIATVEALGLGDQGRYIAALTFGNVHGVYKPGNVKLRPELLGEIQRGIQEKYGTGAKPLDLVFHGGSGSTDEEISEAVSNGVVKMNIDTDTQYAYSRSIADTVLRNYDGFLKIDGEVGNKKVYDPRSWGKKAETAMAQRVVDATRQLGSAGHSGK